MKKYNTDKELKKYTWFRYPVNRFILFLANIFLSIMPKGFHKDKVDIKYIKINDFYIHIIIPKALLGKKLPLLFYIHGGGFMFKAHKGHYLGEEYFALTCKCIVVGIDYALSPKYKYPKAINQCIDAYHYLLNNKDIYNIDFDRVIIGGDSSGGSLVIDTYLGIIDKGLITPKGLLLIYPVIDNKETISMAKYNDTPLWNAKKNKKMWEYYLGDNEYKSPLKRIDDFDIENIYIELAEFDCLHDEGLMLYLSVKDKVQNIILNNTKGTYHGYDINYKAKVSIDSLNKRIEFINKIFNK